MKHVTNTILVTMLLVVVVAVGGFFLVQTNRKRGIEVRERSNDDE